MNKLLKNKKLVVGLLALVVVIMIAIMFVTEYQTYSFKNWVYENYGVNSSAADGDKVNLAEPSLGIMMATPIIAIIVWGIFIGLAFKYSKSHSPKVQGRKWPYIVILVFTTLSLLFSIYSLTKANHGTISIADNVPADVKNTILDKLDNSYGSIFILSIITKILDVALIALSIVALVIISKMKAEKDMQMTDAVLQTGIEEQKTQDHNDLP